MGNPQRTDPTLVASGATGALADNPLDKNLVPGSYNPADYESAVARGESPISTTAVPEVIAPALVTPDEKMAAETGRPPVDIFGGPVQNLTAGRTAESSASESASPNPQPSLVDKWDAALVENNILSRWASDLQSDGLPTYPAVPGYDPWKDIENTPYFQYSSEFIRSDSPTETQAIKHRIDDRNRHEAMLANRSGRAMAFASGVFDPITVATMAIPVAPEVLGASRLARIALGVGVQAGIQTGQELYLHPEQSGTDLALNVGAGALLTGVLGGIATRVPRNEFEAGRKALEDEMHGIVPPPESSTAGAMHAGTTLEQETLARGGNFIANTAGKISPVTRVMQSTTLEGRQLAQQLVDPAGYLEKNFEGIATPHSAEAVIKTTLNKRNYGTVQALETAYKQYRVRLGAEPGLSMAQFGAEVTRALSDGGIHATIPEAAELARETAKAVFNPDRAVLEEQGMLPEGTTVVGAKGYVPRVYDQPRIAADPKALESVLEDWYTQHPMGEQELLDARKETQAAAEKLAAAKAEHANGVVDFYHGSHTPVAEFNAAHMGTGEGNQNFGIGHYVGEMPGTGLHYVPEAGGYLMHGQASQQVVNDMLDLEKSLKRQPRILEKLGIDPEAPVPLNGINPEWSGRELHDALAAGKTNVGAGATKQGAADFLKSKGITGIKYLDQVSRKQGRGSRNLVFFNSADAKILGHEKVAPIGERLGSGLSEKLAAHADEALAARVAAKDAVRAAREAHTAARVTERRAQKLTELGRTAPEIKQRVMETMDHIQGTQRGNADIGGPRTPNVLKARVLDVPDKLLEPFLMRNYEDVMHGYHRSVVPAMEMQRRFGSIDLKNELDAVDDAYRVKRVGATGKQAEKLRQEQSKIRGDLEALRDRVLGTARDSAGGSQKFVRALAIARAYNYLRLLGKQTISSLSDYGRLIAHYGLIRTGAATAKFLTNVAANGLVRGDAKDMGHALEWVLDTRAKTLGEIGDAVAGTRAEKLAKSATHAYTRLTLMATWNATMKDLGSMLEQQAIHRAIMGDTISAIDRAKLASHGFGDAELARIKTQWMKYGANEHGLNRARTQAWDDKEAAQLLETGIGKAVDIVAALNVGKGDLPVLMNSSVWRTLLQFKSYGMASVNRIMIPLAQGVAHGDLAAANGLGMMMTIGGLTYWLKAKVSGTEPDLSPTRVTMESLNWSGALGFLPDVYDPIAGMAHLPRFSRFQDRSISESLGGPTVGTVDTLMRSTSGLIPRGPWSPGPVPREQGLTAQQVHQWRMLLPLQNHFATARLFNALEGETASALGAQGATSQSFGERVMETKPATK